MVALIGSVPQVARGLRIDMDGLGRAVDESNRLPAPRSDAGVAFDAQTGSLVVFGGEASGHPSNDMWTWNEQRGWERVPTESAGWPEPRFGHRIVSFPRQALIMFGGRNRGTFFGQTWKWNLSAKKWIATGDGPSDPPGRADFGFVYCRRKGTAFMYAGRNESGLLGDLWELKADGRTWVPIWSPTRSAGPSPRAGIAMACDEKRGRLVVFGGDRGDSILGLSLPVHDLWEWDISRRRWVDQTPPSGDPNVLAPPPGWPERRQAHEMIYDPSRRATILFGGRNTASSLFGTWARKGSTWTALTPSGPSLITPAREPSPRDWAGLVYDDVNRQIILFGGHSMLTNDDTNDVWLLNSDEDRWREVVPTATASPARNGDVPPLSRPKQQECCGGTSSKRKFIPYQQFRQPE